LEIPRAIISIIVELLMPSIALLSKRIDYQLEIPNHLARRKTPDDKMDRKPILNLQLVGRHDDASSSSPVAFLTSCLLPYVSNGLGTEMKAEANSRDGLFQ
jgi:hypothetical protein